jgi:hypothetical protein
MGSVLLNGTITMRPTTPFGGPYGQTTLGKTDSIAAENTVNNGIARAQKMTNNTVIPAFLI